MEKKKQITLTMEEWLIIQNELWIRAMEYDIPKLDEVLEKLKSKLK